MPLLNEDGTWKKPKYWGKGIRRLYTANDIEWLKAHYGKMPTENLALWYAHKRGRPLCVQKLRALLHKFGITSDSEKGKHKHLVICVRKFLNK